MPNLRMCSHCRAFVNPSEKTCPYCGNPMNARPQPVGGSDERVAGFILSSRFVSTCLLLINFGFFMLCVILSERIGQGFSIMGFPGAVVDLLGAKSGFRIVGQGEWWRLIAAGMLHGGLIHFAMNSYVLFDVGPMVEEFYGSYRMILIYVLGSIAGFTASLWWAPQSMSVGASAGICALVGAMIAYGYRYRTSMAGAMRGHFIRWMVYMVILGLIVDIIDNAAHIGGLAGGFAVAWITGGKSLFDDWRERIIKSLCYTVLILVAYTFVKIFQQLTMGAG